MLTFAHDHYVPVLKCKRGEVTAVRDLKPDVLERITPLYEIPFASENNDRGADEQLFATLSMLCERHPSEAAFFVDIHYMDQSRDVQGVPILKYICEYLSSQGLHPVPVLTLEGSDLAEQIRDHASTHGVAVRFGEQDIEREDIKGDLVKLIEQSSSSPSQAHLIVDMQQVSAETLVRTGIAAREALREAGSLPWATTTLVSTSWPALQDYKTGDYVEVERLDWALWEKTRGRLERQPAFGDYGLDQPGMIDFDFATMTPGVNLRYSSDGIYILNKGGSLKKHGGVKFIELCHNLSRRNAYQPLDCWADDFIAKCISGEGTSGNGESWRRIATNRHLTVVANQLATLPAVP